MLIYPRTVPQNPEDASNPPSPMPAGGWSHHKQLAPFARAAVDAIAGVVAAGGDTLKIRPAFLNGFLFFFFSNTGSPIIPGYTLIRSFPMPILPRRIGAAGDSCQSCSMFLPSCSPVARYPPGPEI